MRRSSSPRTPVKRGRNRTRTIPPTPRSMSRRSTRSAMSIAGRSVASRLGMGALRSMSTNPYVRGALAVAPYARRGYRLLRRYITRKTTKPGKRSGASNSKSSGYFSDFKGDKSPKISEFMYKGACVSYE